MNACRVGAVCVLMGCVALAGCRAKQAKNGDGVDLQTPFGGMAVKTDLNEVQAQIGLGVYPGAVPDKADGKDSGAANVNLSFGAFHVGVKAASYTTPDAPGKVEAFYRKDLAQYGTVIQCSNGHTVGQPAVTQEGLRCDSGKGTDVDTGLEKDDVELKTGSPTHQHIVGVNQNGSGTKFGLVALDLPRNLGGADGGKQ